MMKKYLETGKIVGTHGIKGEVRVQPWSDSPAFLANLKTIYTDNEGKNALKITVARPHHNIVLFKLDGVDTIEAAERYRGKVLYLDRDEVELAEGDHFIDDLIGCDVFDADTNEPLGKLTDVSETGANDVWHITKENKEYLIPAIPDVVIDINVLESKIIIRPLKGIFSDED